MRLSTITNWAYGATVLLTLASGTTMLFASGAEQRERAAVAQLAGQRGVVDADLVAGLAAVLALREGTPAEREAFVGGQ